MTDKELNPLVTNAPQHAETSVSFLARSKKAVAGGIAGAIAAGGTAVTSAFGDGSFNESDAWIIAGVVVGGFALGFVGVWNAPANEK